MTEIKVGGVYNPEQRAFFGRSYLLGNRKGLAGLKNQKEGDESGLYFEVKATANQKQIRGDFGENMDIFSSSYAAFLVPAGAHTLDTGPLKTLKPTRLSKPLSSECLVTLWLLCHISL